MKIIKEGSAYIQLNDIHTIMDSDCIVPISFVEAVYNNGELIVTDDNRHDFVTFTGEENIRFVNSLNFLLDYNEVSNLTSKDDYKAFGNRIEDEKKRIEEKISSSDQRDIDAIKKMLLNCHLLEEKMLSLRNVLWYAQGKLPMTLPDGVEPLSYKRTAGDNIKRFIMDFTSKK